MADSIMSRTSIMSPPGDIEIEARDLSVLYGPTRAV